jgi:hypothetical protein
MADAQFTALVFLPLMGVRANRWLVHDTDASALQPG